MQRIRMAALSILTLVSLQMVEPRPNAEAAAPARKATPPQVAVRALDPIEFIGGSEVPGKKEIYFDYHNLRYLFANQKNRERFKKDPGRYAIQGDGTCPVAPQFQANPNYVLVYNERIYAFADIGCMLPFGESPERYLSRWQGNKQKKN